MAKAPTSISFETGMLAFARSLQITEGLFFGTSRDTPDVKTPIEILEKGVRGQSSEDKAKNPGLSNPQTVEYAIVPQGHDGIALSFHMRFMPLSLKPYSCGDDAVAKSYERLSAAYKSAGGYRVLAALYAWNIANGRFAWRNRYQSDEMSVAVTFGTHRLEFNPLSLSLETAADEGEMADALISGTADDLAALIDGIAFGLSNDTKEAFSLEVTWHAAMAPGQEVFPSQEYVREAKNDKTLARILAKIPAVTGGRRIEQASMHSQKIGAALRHIDIWHHDDVYTAAIAVNPYGGVQETGAVLRSNSKSFYKLRSKAASLIEAIEAATAPDEITEDTHFVMANIVRGGVFGSSSKKAGAAA